MKKLFSLICVAGLSLLSFQQFTAHEADHFITEHQHIQIAEKAGSVKIDMHDIAESKEANPDGNINPLTGCHYGDVKYQNQCVHGNPVGQNYCQVYPENCHQTVPFFNTSPGFWITK